MCPPSWTPLPPPSPSNPSGLSQCTGPERPVSFIRPGLAIYFTYANIRVSMLFSQIIPPLPFPQNSKVCSLHLCLFCCLTYRGHGYHLSKFQIYVLIYCIGVFLCPVLTVASWPAYRFLKRQVRWSGIHISFRIFHSLLWSTQSAIKKNTFESVLMRWMKQEPIIQSEVSQKEKHQYSILTHIFGI